MKQHVLKSTFIIIIATMLLRLLGFAREMVLASVYGAGVVTDAFVVATTIPYVVLAFIGGSVASMYIPLYQKHKEQANLFTSNVVNLLFLIGLAFSLIFMLFPKPLVLLFASQLDAETFALTTAMLRIMVWTAIPVFIAEIFRGYLQIHGSFFHAVAAGGFVNIFIIAFIWISHSQNNPSLMGVGAVAGNIVCLLFLFTSSVRREYKHRLYLKPFDDEIKELLHLIAPVILVTAMAEVNLIIDRNFASSLSSGAISSLNYASRLINLAVNLSGTALATVLFPMMSEAAANDNIDKLKDMLTGSVRKLFPVLLPLTAGVIFMAHPIVRILFERGAFTPEDTKRTAECLQMYSLVLLGSGINIVLQRSLYAVKKTKAAALISALTIGIVITLNFLFIGPLKHMGLALSTSIATMFSTVMLIFTLRKIFGPLGLRSQIKELVKTLIAAALMSAAVFASYRVFDVMEKDTVACILYSALLVAIGVVTYALAHALMKTEFFHDCFEKAREISAKLRSKFRK